MVSGDWWRVATFMIVCVRHAKGGCPNPCVCCKRFLQGWAATEWSLRIVSLSMFSGGRTRDLVSRNACCRSDLVIFLVSCILFTCSLFKRKSIPLHSICFRTRVAEAEVSQEFRFIPPVRVMIGTPKPTRLASNFQCLVSGPCRIGGCALVALG